MFGIIRGIREKQEVRRLVGTDRNSGMSEESPVYNLLPRGAPGEGTSAREVRYSELEIGGGSLLLLSPLYLSMN